MSAHPEIHGQPPALAGAVCEELRCQQYWHRGELVDEFNVIYLRVRDVWHRLALDCGVIFWRVSDDARASFDTPESGDSYRIVDLGMQLGVGGRELERYEMRRITDGAEVVFIFTGGRSLTFRNVGDRNSLAA